MLPADPFAVRPNMTFRTAAKDEFTRWEPQILSLRSSLEDFQAHIHNEPFPGRNELGGFRGAWQSRPL
jgi:hypothetical protein